MTRSLCIFVCLSLLGFTAKADDSAVIGDLPAGVIVYDAVAPSAPAPLVVLPEADAADPVPSFAPLTQSGASTRSSFAQPITGQVFQSGAELNPALVTPQINLGPGETVLQAIAAPSAIVRIPLTPQPAYTITSGPPPASRPSARVAPEPIVDPVSGRLRDTPGWTGRREGPASIGCFPAGACAVLNQR